MPQITIQGTVIDFPDSASSPDWSQAVIQFAQTVESALSSVVGAYDVAPQSFVIDSYNPSSNISIPNLSFSTTAVRAAFVKYTVYRTTTLTNAYEAGNIIVVYNSANPVGNKWEIITERAGDASISLTITDTGQFQLSTTALSGLNHAGKIVYSATSLAQ